jgi:hypothetical protein
MRLDRLSSLVHETIKAMSIVGGHLESHLRSSPAWSPGEAVERQLANRAIDSG